MRTNVDLTNTSSKFLPGELLLLNFLPKGRKVFQVLKYMKA